MPHRSSPEQAALNDFVRSRAYARPVPRAILFGLALLAVCVPSAAAAATRLPGFHSPSGNIKCLYLPNEPMLLCHIGQASYAKTLQALCIGPSGTGVDWHGFTLGATKAGQVNSYGGIQYNPTTQRPSYVNQPYGTSWRHGAFTCASRITGVTCRNARGHGLFISRESWRAW